MPRSADLKRMPLKMSHISNEKWSRKEVIGGDMSVSWDGSNGSSPGSPKTSLPRCEPLGPLKRLS